MVYGALLKDDTELHNRVKAELKEQLSSGLSSKTQERVYEYWQVLTKKFYVEFGRTRDMGEALKYSFCATLSEKYPDWGRLNELSGLLSANSFVRIFRYCYGAVEKSLNTQ